MEFELQELGEKNKSGTKIKEMEEEEINEKAREIKILNGLIYILCSTESCCLYFIFLDIHILDAVFKRESSKR